MTWDPTFDSGSHLIACEPLWLERMQSLSFVSGLPMVPCSPHQLPCTRSQWCFLKTSYLWFCLYCAFPRNHLGATSGTWLDGGEVCPGKPPKPFGRSAFSYWSLQTLPTLLPSSAETFAVQPIQEPKYFPPNCLLPCSCWRMRARAQYVPMKRQNLSKTLKVAKKSISSHKLFIIIVTSTIHYATENNCKEISQDRNLVRMHHHHHVWKTAKLNDLSNCLFFILQAKMRSTM